jgi:SMC interacting uncharacterized protein involved in chromosome segregation
MARKNLKRRITALTKLVDDTPLATKIQAFTAKIYKLETRLTSLQSQGKSIAGVQAQIRTAKKRTRRLGEQLSKLPIRSEHISSIKQMIEHLSSKLSKSVHHSDLTGIENHERH